MPDLGEIVFCKPNKMECVLQDKVSGDQESCFVITCFLCKMKIMLPIVLKCIAVSRGNLSLLLYINRLSSAAGHVE